MHPNKQKFKTSKETLYFYYTKYFKIHKKLKQKIEKNRKQKTHKNRKKLKHGTNINEKK